MSLNMKTCNKYSNFKNSLYCDNSIEKKLEGTSNHTDKMGKNNLAILELCNKKLSKKPNNKRALLLRASIYIKMHKYEEAENDLQLLLKDGNLASTAYYLLGLINKESNNNELALEYFTKSIELDNNNINAYFLRGAVNNILGNYKDAIKDYNDAIYKDTLKTEGKNIYKNISKIFAQTLYNQRKYSRKNNRRNSLINNRKNNYILDALHLNYNCEKEDNNNTIEKKNKYKNKCSSEENNIKTKNFTSDSISNSGNSGKKLRNLQKIENIVFNSTSNNFNFFIRDISDKKMNERFYNTQKLLKEINGFLNEDENDERLSINLNVQSNNKNEESIKNRTSDVFAKSIATTDCDGYSSINNQNISTLLTNNTSNKNSIITNDMNNKFANTQSFYSANSLSEFGSNNNTINNFSNSLKTKKSTNIIDKYNKNENMRNIINQNISLIIGKNINNLYTYKTNEKNSLDSIKNSNNNEINFTSEQKPLLYATNEPKESNLEKEKLKEDDLLCIKGEIARNHGNYYDAIDLFTKAIQLNPKSFKAFFNRAFTYDKIGLYKEAICDYTSTIDIKPNHSFCYYNRGITYNKLGDYKKSIHDFSKAIELEPNKPEFYFNRACLYKNIKNYQSAIEDYNIVIKLFPKLYTPIYNRGICYEKLKMNENSIKDFETCIQMAKNNIHPYYHLATIYKNLEQYDTSIKYLKQLIDIKDDYSPAYHDIGVILTQFGKYETAIQYFNKCIELDNKKSIYYHNRGWAYRYINPQNAIEDMTMAIKLDNKNPVFYFNRASIYKNEKMYDKAIEDYSFLILKLNKKSHEVYVNRAFCFAQRNIFFDAINDYTKAIELKNDDYNSLSARADLYINIKNYFLAIDDLNQIIKMDPNNEKAYIKRAKCFEKIKNIKESCNDYERALILSGKKA